MENEVRLIDANAFLANQMRIARAKETEEQRMYWAGVDDTLGDIVDAPTIDPESLRPTGRWVDPKWNDMWQSMTVTCSHCLERGEVRVRTNEHGMKVINSPSCPNCGAKMEG